MASSLAVLIAAWITLADALQLGRQGDGDAGESLPVVTLRLAPAERPLPEITASLASLVAAREAAETGLLAGLQTEFNAVLSNAKAAIKNRVASARAAAPHGAQYGGAAEMTHTVEGRRAALGGDDNVFAVRVGVQPREPPSRAAADKIERIEKKQSRAEAYVFEQAKKEMRRLTAIVLAELSDALAPQARTAAEGTRLADFLEGEANVRVGAPVAPFPAVADLVEDMEERLDAGEEQAREKILDMLSKLAQAEVGAVRETLGSGRA